MAADSLAKASTHEPVGPKPLWGHPGWQLPAYIQHIANDLREKRGLTESVAIATAIAAVKRWASGIGKVDDNTRAAAQKAVAEWERLKTAAHASLSEEDFAELEKNLAGLEAGDDGEGGVDLAQVQTNIGALEEVEGALLTYLGKEKDPDDLAEAKSLLQRVYALIAKDRAEAAAGGPIRHMYGDEAEATILAELFFAESATGAPGEDGLVYKTILREGHWKYSPNDQAGKKPVGITVVKDGKSDPVKLVVSMSELKKNFENDAVEHVTIPTSHKDGVLENTGFIKDLRLAKDKEGRWILEAGMDFTEPDVKAKAERGSIANTSAGVLFDYLRKEDGKKFGAVLAHAALTNRPWLTGMTPFGVAASQEGGVTVMSFAEEGAFTSEELEEILSDTKPDAAADGADVVLTAENGGDQVLILAGGGFQAITKCKMDDGKDGYKGRDGTCYPDLKSAMKTHAAAMSEEELELAVGTTAKTGKTPTKPYGDVTYADPGYQKDGTPRYPLDSEQHVRAGWAYINKTKNAAAYSKGQLSKIKSRIRAAMKKLGADVNMSDDLLTIENEKALQALMAEGVATTEGGDNAVDSKDTDQYVERFGLNEDEIAEALKERVALKLSQQETGVKAKIAKWEDEKKSPAILKEAETILLADPGTIAVHLSEEDGDKSTDLTLSEVVERLVNASPAITLEQKKVTEAKSSEGTAPVEEEEVELSAEVEAEARRLYLYEGKTEDEAIAAAQAKFAKNSEQ